MSDQPQHSNAKDYSDLENQHFSLIQVSSLKNIGNKQVELTFSSAISLFDAANFTDLILSKDNLTFGVTHNASNQFQIILDESHFSGCPYADEAQMMTYAASTKVKSLIFTLDLQSGQGSKKFPDDINEFSFIFCGTYQQIEVIEDDIEAEDHLIQGNDEYVKGSNLETNKAWQAIKLALEKDYLGYMSGVTDKCNDAKEAGQGELSEDEEIPEASTVQVSKEEKPTQRAYDEDQATSSWNTHLLSFNKLVPDLPQPIEWEKIVKSMSKRQGGSGNIRVYINNIEKTFEGWEDYALFIVNRASQHLREIEEAKSAGNVKKYGEYWEKLLNNRSMWKSNDKRFNQELPTDYYSKNLKKEFIFDLVSIMNLGQDQATEILQFLVNKMSVGAVKPFFSLEDEDHLLKSLSTDKPSMSHAVQACGLDSDRLERALEYFRSPCFTVRQFNKNTDTAAYRNQQALQKGQYLKKKKEDLYQKDQEATFALKKKLIVYLNKNKRNTLNNRLWQNQKKSLNTLSIVDLIRQVNLPALVDNQQIDLFTEMTRFIYELGSTSDDLIWNEQSEDAFSIGRNIPLVRGYSLDIDSILTPTFPDWLVSIKTGENLSSDKQSAPPIPGLQSRSISVDDFLFNERCQFFGMTPLMLAAANGNAKAFMQIIKAFEVKSSSQLQHALKKAGPDGRTSLDWLEHYFDTKGSDLNLEQGTDKLPTWLDVICYLEKKNLIDLDLLSKLPSVTKVWILSLLLKQLGIESQHTAEVISVFHCLFIKQCQRNSNPQYKLGDDWISVDGENKITLSFTNVIRLGSALQHIFLSKVTKREITRFSGFVEQNLPSSSVFKIIRPINPIKPKSADDMEYLFNEANLIESLLGYDASKSFAMIKFRSLLVALSTLFVKHDQKLHSQLLNDSNIPSIKKCNESDSHFLWMFYSFSLISDEQMSGIMVMNNLLLTYEKGLKYLQKHIITIDDGPTMRHLKGYLVKLKESIATLFNKIDDLSSDNKNASNAVTKNTRRNYLFKAGGQKVPSQRLTSDQEGELKKKITKLLAQLIVCIEKIDEDKKRLQPEVDVKLVASSMTLS